MKQTHPLRCIYRLVGYKIKCVLSLTCVWPLLFSSSSEQAGGDAVSRADSSPRGEGSNTHTGHTLSPYSGRTHLDLQQSVIF